MTDGNGLPAVRFVNSPWWEKAGWAATTFRCHPAGEAPPLLGIVFADCESGRQIFRDWVAECGNVDELEEIRIAVIEGEIPGQEPGYSIHICPDPQNVLVRATAQGIVADSLPFGGKINRMYPLPNMSAMLPNFRQSFEQHGEFLLAPVAPRADGQLWFDVVSELSRTPSTFATLPTSVKTISTR